MNEKNSSSDRVLGSYVYRLLESVEGLPFMKHFRIPIIIMIALVTCIGSYFMVRSLFSGISKEYILLFLTGFGWLLGQLILKNKEIEQKHIEKKMDAYQKFINEFIDYFIVNKAKADKEEIFKKSMIDLKKAVYVWGKPQMIKDMIKLQSMFIEFGSKTNQSEQNELIFNTLDFIFKIIRKDIGHNDATLNNLELAQMCITDDIHKTLQENK